MDPFLDNLTLEQLDGDAFDLAELIGMDAFKKLVEVYGGSSILYVPTFAKLRNAARDRQLLQEYQSRKNLKHLARKFQMSERRARQIIHDYKAQEAAQDG